MARNLIIRENPPGVPTITDETPHACWDGWVYLGRIAWDEETGEDVEVIERVPCRRCSETRLTRPRSY
jgi:hypothetical protein